MTDDKQIPDNWQPPRYTRWRWRREATYLRGPRAVALMWVWTAIKAAVVLGSWIFLWDHHSTGGGWVDAIASVVVGVAVGLSTLDIPRRALAYKVGWSSGRQSMYASFFEAHERGFTPGEWLGAELERDRVRLGISEEP